MERTIHHGRNVKRFREMPGITGNPGIIKSTVNPLLQNLCVDRMLFHRSYTPLHTFIRHIIFTVSDHLIYRVVQVKTMYTEHTNVFSLRSRRLSAASQANYPGRDAKFRTTSMFPEYETFGMTCKPLYKIAEVCAMFYVSKPTIYDWIKHGKLKPYKIRSRVYFLWQDIQQLLRPNDVIQKP